MKYGAKFVLMVTIIIVMGFGCAKREENITKLFPLSVENKWVYQSLYWSEKDTISSIDSSYIVESYKWNKRITYHEVRRGTDTTGMAFYVDRWWIIEDDELRSYYESPTDTSAYFIILRKPLKAGTHWICDIPDSIWKTEIESVNVTVKVPAGTFRNCLQITRYEENGEVLLRYWLAPNVGLIRSYSELGWDEKLLRYEIK
ncbi:MAG TPA: hypothetical protein EYP60_08585 [bacterium (Candidatus Stahlbacteria)]|nr:hypothetical protein [Candidatus Stahlbacteria bacterium]